jgi:nitroimidazol reductase NimA-like FMN-containing flavoprotein (pyridoxamine 5'-phosphate oxidase superfamily)
MPLRIEDRSRPSTPGYFKAAHEGSGLLEWEPIATRFAASRNYWVSTASLQGRPHAMPVWGVWLDDRFVFSTSPQSRKARNLRANAYAAVHLEDGNAVIVVEGRVRELRDIAELSAFLTAYNPKYGWNFTPDQVTEGTFEVAPKWAFAWLGGEGEAFGGTATRWRFARPESERPRPETIESKRAKGKRPPKARPTSKRNENSETRRPKPKPTKSKTTTKPKTTKPSRTKKKRT